VYDKTLLSLKAGGESMGKRLVAVTFLALKTHHSFDMSHSQDTAHGI